MGNKKHRPSHTPAFQPIGSQPLGIRPPSQQRIQSAPGGGNAAGGTSFDPKQVAEITKIVEAEADKLKKEIENKMTDREVRVMEVLAVFVVVLTFVSTNISIFNRISDLSTAVFFMAGMTVCLIAFFSVLFSILYKSHPDNKSFKNPFLQWWVIWFPIIITLLIIGMLVLCPWLNAPFNPPASQTQQ